MQYNADINYMALLRTSQAKGTVFQDSPYLKHQPWVQGFPSHSPSDQQTTNSVVSTTPLGLNIPQNNSQNSGKFCTMITALL